MAVVLLIKTEDGEVSELAILRKTTLGRSGNSDFKIADIKMSGTHCSFDVNKNGQLVFKDLGTTNGSFLNNSIIAETIVKVNDIIRIGNTLIKIDEKKLSTSERKTIGISILSVSNDKTLPILKATLSEEPTKKKATIINKFSKDKKPTVSSWGSSENVIEQEESDGNTKFLKLNIPDSKLGKKKK